MLGMSRKKSVAWLFTLTFIGTAFGLIVVVLLWFVNGAVGTSTTLAAAQKSIAPKPLQPNLLSGIDIEMSYPGIFDQVSHVNNDKNALEQYNLGSNSDYRRAIGISVHPLPSNNVNEDSSYRFRMNSTDTYRESKSTIGKEPIYLMTKIDRTEQSLFWLHQGKLLIVAITSTNPKDDVAAIMSTIQPTIRWRQ
jgi:hypothetical protein